MPEIDISSMKPEEIKEALKRLNELEEKNRKSLDRGERLRVRNKILMDKALAAGFDVTEEEIDTFLMDKHNRDTLRAAEQKEKEETPAVSTEEKK